MHVLTGMLIAALLGKRSNRPAVLALKTGPVRTDHWLPGRVRFRIPSLGENAEGVGLLEQKLPTLPGVRRVEIHRATGSLLIDYAPDEVQPELLFAAAVRLLGLDDQLTSTPSPRIVGELRSVVAALNRAVYDRTSGLLDFTSALMILLAATGVRGVMREGIRSLPAGFTLLYWGLTHLLREPAE